MKLLKSIFLLLAVSAMAFQSCNTVKDISASALDGKWVLKTLDGQSADQLFAGKLPTVEFNASAGSISGTGGCNNYNGKYTLSKNKLSAPNLASTMMACAHANKEYEFTKALSTTSDLSIKGGNLVLTQNGKAALVFEKAKPLSPADFAGTWELQSIGGASSNTLFSEKTPTIQFDFGTKRVTGNAGCNTFNGNFELGAKTITFDRLITTRMACPSLKGEGQFIENLTGKADLSLENGLLVLRRDGKHLLSFIKKTR